jgi:putative Holliday junction resolvase
MGRILAIDFGKRHIGLAISDETKTIATGLDTIYYKDRKEIIEKLKVIIKDRDVEKIVMGYPIAMSGKITQIGLEVLDFKTRLQQELNMNIELLDERFTTEMSRRVVQEMKRKPTPPKGLLDKISAVIMLEDYLQFRKK